MHYKTNLIKINWYWHRMQVHNCFDISKHLNAILHQHNVVGFNINTI